MQGEQLEHAELLPPGLLGDRAFALIDVATGRVVSALMFEIDTFAR